MNVKLESSWKAALAEEFTKPYFVDLTNFVRDEYRTNTVYPLLVYSYLIVESGVMSLLVLKICMEVMGHID